MARAEKPVVTADDFVAADEPSDLPTPVRFESPWGSQITVSSDIVDSFTELGYKPKR